MVEGACVRACLPRFLFQLRIGLYGDPTSPQSTHAFISLAPIVSFQSCYSKKEKTCKQQKHSHNQNHKNIFTTNLDSRSSDPLLLVYFLNQTLIDLIPLQVIFFNIKKRKPILICHLAFHFKTIFKTNKKHKNKSNVNFYPELRGFDPSRVRRQRTLVLPNQ